MEKTNLIYSSTKSIFDVRIVRWAVPWCGIAFCQPTYHLRHWVRITSGALLTVARVQTTGVGFNLVHEDILPCLWKECFRRILWPPLWLASQAVINSKGVLPLLGPIENLLVRGWVRIVVNIAVDPFLGTSFKEQCTCKIYQAKRNIFPCHSKQVDINISRTSMKYCRYMQMWTCVTVKEFTLLGSVWQKELIPFWASNFDSAQTQKAVLVQDQGAVFMVIKTLSIIAEPWWYDRTRSNGSYFWKVLSCVHCEVDGQDD